jgi:alpha-beta hydrolase superfamily lysophospholipase
MGGAIAMVTALRSPTQFNGFVFSAPAILKGEDIPDWIVPVARVLEWCWPSMGLKKIPILDLTSIVEEQKAVENDPHCFHGYVSKASLSAM